MTDFDNRFVALKKESAYGTPSGDYVFGEVDDESIRHTFDLLTREDMSRYGSAKSVTGKEFSEGSVNMAMMADNFMGNILMGMMGTDTVTGASDPYTHTFTEAGTLASYTFLVSREDKEHLYKGCVIDSLSVSAALNEYASVSFNLMGKSEDIASLGAVGTTTPTFADNLDALYFSNAKVFFNGNATASDAVADISFDINLNRDGDNACALGSTTYVRAPPVQRRVVTGSITFNQVIHTATVDEPTYTELTTEDGHQLSGSGVELKVQFGDDSTADRLTFNFYKIRFEAADANVSGRDTNTMTVNFVALYSPDDSKMMDIVLKNSTSGAY